MAQGDINNDVEQFEKLEISSSLGFATVSDSTHSAARHSDSSDSPAQAKTGIHTLPEELVQLIANCIWREKERKSWYDRLEESAHCDGGEERKRMRMDCLAFSSCCRGMRRSIFQEYLLANVTVDFCEQEWLSLASLSEKNRSYIK
jgi:hypothetical protein